MALDRFVDDAGSFPRCPGDEREIDFSHCAGGKLFRQIAVGRVVLGNDEGAAGFLVETMHDAGPFLSADPGKILAMREERVHKGSLLMAGAGMNDEPGRLVEHEEIVVLEQNVERYRLGLGVALFNLRLAHFDNVAGPNRVAWSRRLSVQSDEFFPDQRLEPGAGERREGQGERAVEPLPGLVA